MVVVGRPTFPELIQGRRKVPLIFCLSFHIRSAPILATLRSIISLSFPQKKSFPFLPLFLFVVTLHSRSCFSIQNKREDTRSNSICASSLFFLPRKIPSPFRAGGGCPSRVRERERLGPLYTSYGSPSHRKFQEGGEKGWDIGLGEVGPVFPGRDVERGRGPGRR